MQRKIYQSFLIEKRTETFGLRQKFVNKNEKSVPNCVPKDGSVSTSNKVLPFNIFKVEKTNPWGSKYKSRNSQYVIFFKKKWKHVWVKEKVVRKEQP